MSATLEAKLAAFNPRLPLAQARTIPSLWYFDPEIYSAECRSVFGQGWLALGRLDQVAEPGQFCTADLAGEPILVVRDGAGSLRALVNVCRHRAARVACEAQGKTSRFRCRYHGWTYDLSGRLIGTPEFEGVADFHKAEQGLPSLPVATWGPLVWVRMGQRPAETSADSSLEAFLAPLPEQTAGLGLERLRFVARREYLLDCNWKVFVDNYLDGGYHVNTIHPGLAGVVDYTHYRTEIAGNTSVQISPLRPPDPADVHAGVGQVRAGRDAYYWWIFPNLMLNIYDGLMDTNLVLPLGPERCRVIFDFYFADDQRADAADYQAQSMAVADQIQQEDMAICEDVQRGLHSRSFDTGRFSVRREGAGYHFHRLLAKALQAHSKSPGS